jgi:hypothetical protein
MNTVCGMSSDEKHVPCQVCGDTLRHLSAAQLWERELREEQRQRELREDQRQRELREDQRQRELRAHELQLLEYSRQRAGISSVVSSATLYSVVDPTASPTILEFFTVSGINVPDSLGFGIAVIIVPRCPHIQRTQSSGWLDSLCPGAREIGESSSLPRHTHTSDPVRP